MTRAWIVAIGSELTSGQSLDTNSAWLSRELAGLGIRSERHVTVADDLAAIVELLRAAGEHADVLLVSGGLGPTADDLTRDALAQAAGLPLELDTASLEQIEAFFAARGRKMADANRVQAMRPRGARAIVNTCGTAPGIAMRLGKAEAFAMPGVPFEMRRMFERDVAPALRGHAADCAIVHATLRTIGLAESDLGARIADLMQRGRNPEVGTAANLGVIAIRIAATAGSRRQAQALIEADETELRARLGRCVFGQDDDTLAAVVGRLLSAAGQTVSTAESCTGGLIAEQLTDVSGSSVYYVGGAVAYSNELKTRLLGVDPDLIARHGAVSEPVAQAMARGAVERFGSDHAIAVTGIAGPTGGTAERPVGLVYVAIADRSGAIVRRLLLGRDTPRDVIRQRAAAAALNMLRERLLDAGGTRAGTEACPTA